MNLATEIYQLLFISSIIFMVYVISDVAMKMFGRFIRKNPAVKYAISNTKKILFWISLAVFLSYII